MRIRICSLSFLLGTALLFSCKKSSDPVGPDACATASTRAQAYSDAVQAYVKAPTAANCAAFKAAGNAYLDAAAGCSTVLKADVDAARASINNSSC